MDQTLNTLEMMLIVAAENKQLESALLTTQQIVRGMRDEEIDKLDEELKVRAGWCGRMTQHEARNLIHNVASLERSARRLFDAAAMRHD